MTEIRPLCENEIEKDLFRYHKRHQIVTKCRRKVDGEWTVVDAPFVENWGEKEYEFLAKCLRNTVSTNGAVYGAFVDGQLKGWASVEGEFLGSGKQYLDLSSMHVSEDCRRNGLGRKLMERAALFAKERGAEKLYISAHPAVESQAFYAAMGCVEAEEYSARHVEMEPVDCQMELVL